MKVTVNNKEVSTEATHLSGLIAQLNLPAAGVAAAVNNKMVPRTQWDEYVLTPDAKVTIIKAACGG